MVTRDTYPGWTDVRLNGHVVGFVVEPSTAGGKWHAYLDNIGSSGSRRVASANSKDAAVEEVKKAAKSG